MRHASALVFATLVIAAVLPLARARRRQAQEEESNAESGAKEEPLGATNVADGRLGQAVTDARSALKRWGEKLGQMVGYTRPDTGVPRVQEGEAVSEHTHGEWQTI